MSDTTEAGHVSVEEAREILSRFVHSHFREGERARISIPADPRRDDDIRLAVFIDQVATAREALREVLAEYEDALCQLDGSASWYRAKHALSEAELADLRKRGGLT
jgi:hypothetical protein